MLGQTHNLTFLGIYSYSHKRARRKVSTQFAGTLKEGKARFMHAIAATNGCQTQTNAHPVFHDSRTATSTKPRAVPESNWDSPSQPTKTRNRNAYDRTASLSCFAIRALTTVFAGIWIDSPVAGLRPIRACRFCFTSLTIPGIENSPLVCISLSASDSNSSNIALACAFVVTPSQFSTKCLKSWVLPILAIGVPLRQWRARCGYQNSRARRRQSWLENSIKSGLS